MTSKLVQHLHMLSKQPCPLSGESPSTRIAEIVVSIIDVLFHAGDTRALNAKVLIDCVQLISKLS